MPESPERGPEVAGKAPNISIENAEPGSRFYATQDFKIEGQGFVSQGDVLTVVRNNGATLEVTVKNFDEPDEEAVSMELGADVLQPNLWRPERRGPEGTVRLMGFQRTRELLWAAKGVFRESDTVESVRRLMVRVLDAKLDASGQLEERKQIFRYLAQQPGEQVCLAEVRGMGACASGRFEDGEPAYLFFSEGDILEFTGVVGRNDELGDYVKVEYTPVKPDSTRVAFLRIKPLEAEDWRRKGKRPR